MKSTKKLLMGISSLGLGICSAPDALATVASYPYQKNSPLSAANSQANAKKIAEALKQAAGGRITSQNIEQAIRSVVESNPGISMSVVASSIEQLNLDSDSLKNAVLGMATAFEVPVSQSASAIITETYLNEGKDSANSIIETLKESLGGDVVAQALNESSSQNSSAPFGPTESYGYNSGSGLYNG